MWFPVSYLGLLAWVLFGLSWVQCKIRPYLGRQAVFGNIKLFTFLDIVGMV